MTSDEIVQLKDGSETDVLVAKNVMRWYSDPDVPYFDSVEADGVIHISRKWSPSTDIDSAWEVVEKMIAKFAGFELLRWPSMDGLEDWHALFGNGQVGTFVAQAPTAPLAICRAALLATAQDGRGDAGRAG